VALEAVSLFKCASSATLPLDLDESKDERPDGADAAESHPALPTPASPLPQPTHTFNAQPSLPYDAPVVGSIREVEERRMKVYIRTPNEVFEIDNVDSYKQLGAYGIELHKKSTTVGKQTVLAIVGLGTGTFVTFDAPPKKAE
jgi:hypothetical protein